MKKRVGISLIIVGVVMIFAAGSLILYNSSVDKRAKAVIEENIMLYNSTVEGKDISDYISENNSLKTEQTVEINGREYIGRIDIIDFDLSFPVLAEWTEEGAKTSPCRYSGSYITDDMVVAAHNYRSLFGKLLNIYTGARIRFTDVLGTSTDYVVTDIETISQYDADGMRSGEWDLTLFTCTYGARSRVAVRCVKS